MRRSVKFLAGLMWSATRPAGLAPLIRHTSPEQRFTAGSKRASRIVPWLFLVLAALGAIGTLNALFPLRRPWWLKLASFNLGWLSNELPLHVLAANAVVVAACAAGGSLHGWAGAVGLVLMIGSSVGLAFLAAAHRRAAGDIDAALRQAFGPDDAAGLDSTRRADPPIPRSWLVLPGLAWLSRRREWNESPTWSTRPSRAETSSSTSTGPTPQRSNCPVLVEIHGGGWMAGDRRLDARPLIARMAARGWVCVSVDYRLSPEPPGPTTSWTSRPRWPGYAPTSPNTAATPTSSPSPAARAADISPPSPP